MKLHAGEFFLFLRHGETDYNLHGIRCGGEIDVPLNATGWLQAEAIARQIRDARFSLRWIAASKLLRVQQTANLVAAHLGLDIEMTDRLNERRLGQWNGMPVAETEAALKAGETPPGGESAEAFRARIVGWLHDWTVRFSTPGIVVASKGVGRVLSEAFARENVSVDNGGLLLFRGRDGDSSVVRLQLGAAEEILHSCQ
jgi:probable phosphoglycerate mutase